MTVREHEDEIRHLSFETAVAWNADGAEVLTKTGEKNRIVFSDEELVLLRGSVFTHNHPGGLAFPENDPRSFGNSFSLSDIRLACFVSLIEYCQQVLEPIYLKHKSEVTREIRLALKSGRLCEAEAMHFHEMCQRTTDEAGLLYQREEF